MRNIKKITSILLVTSMFVSVLLSVKIPVSATTKAEKEFLVLTDNSEALQTAQDLSLASEDVLETEDDMNVSKMTLSTTDVEKLKDTDGVIAVEKDITLKGSTAETSNNGEDVLDALFKKIDTDEINQWNLEAMNIEDEKVVDNIKLELLDSGVNYSEDINVKQRINLVDEDCGVNPLFEDYSGHGTSMAGVICAKDNGIDITGINPNVNLYSVKALDSNAEAPLSRIVKGIYWGIEHNMDIINMSFGTTVNSAILQEAVKAADEAGILMIASSGNESTTGVQYPAAYPQVFAVGSLNAAGEISDFTATGEELDVVAPGENIETTGIFGTVIGTDGTSISTAEVSAIASLILQKDRTKSPDFVKKLMLASAKKIVDGNVTTGAVDYNYAMEIYDEFASSYSPTQNLQEYTNSEPVETYDTDGYVQGLWKKDKHIELAEDSSSCYYSGDYLKLIIAGARAADWSSVGDYTGYKNTAALHGAGNYVANMKCAWQFIRYLNATQSLEQAYDKTCDFMSELPAYKNATDTSIMDDLLICLYYLDTADYKVIDNSIKINTLTPTACKFKAIGLCLHMLGDIYAHRTQVPVAYSSGKFSTQYFTSTPTYKFNTVERKQNALDSAQISDFLANHPGMRKLEALEYATSCGVVEFRDIKKYSNIYHNGDPGPLCTAYEDNPNFYSRRYDEAYCACQFLMANRSMVFHFFTILPNANDEGTSIKLWNFKNYVKYSDYDDFISLNDAEWDTCTSYPKKVNANGNIVRK